MKLFLLPVVALCTVIGGTFGSTTALAASSSAALTGKNTALSVTVKNRHQQAIKAVSGTVIDRDGLVATTCSVVISWLTETQSSLRVVTADGSDMPVLDVLGCSRKTNTAILRIPAEGLPMAPPMQKSAIPGSAWLAGRGNAGETKIVPIQIKVPKKKRPADMIPMTPSQPERLTGGAVLNDRGELIGIGTSVSSGSTVLIPWEVLRGQRDQYQRLARKSRLLDAVAIQRPEASSEPYEVIAAQKRADTEPGNADAWIALGRACQAAHLWNRAITAWNRAALLDPRSSDIQLGLGISAYHAGRYRDAIAAYEKALRLKPDTVAIQIKMGAAWLITGEFRQAIDILKKAIEIDPNSASAHFNLGVAHYLNGDKNSAMIEYLRLKPLDTGLAKNLFDLMN